MPSPCYISVSLGSRSREAHNPPTMLRSICTSSNGSKGTCCITVAPAFAKSRRHLSPPLPSLSRLTAPYLHPHSVPRPDTSHALTCAALQTIQHMPAVVQCLMKHALVCFACAVWPRTYLCAVIPY